MQSQFSHASSVQLKATLLSSPLQCLRPQLPI